MSAKWEAVRHRVVLAGRVRDASSGKPLGDAEVWFTAMPSALKKKLESVSLAHGKAWDKMAERPDRTRTRPDGRFYFLDLPVGKYKLQAALPNQGRRFGKAEESVEVGQDADGYAKMVFVRCALSPTQVNGKITGVGQEGGVALARVRVKGSGERGFTDAQGEYRVAGIEPGKRTLLVSAQGYRAESQMFTLEKPGDSKTLNFNLKRENL